MRYRTRNIRLSLGALGVVAGLLLLSSCSKAPAQSAVNAATWSWTAPTTFVDGTTIPSTDAITYNAYVGTSGTGSEPTTPTVTGVTTTSYTGSGYKPGSVECATFTAVVNTIESSHSNEACKTFPDVPSAPTNNHVS